MTVIAIVTVTYIVANLVPSDPARVIAGSHATAETVAMIRKALGLDKPLWQRYLLFVWQFLHGNLGYDYIEQRPVWQMVSQAAPYTAYLAVVAVCFELLFAVPVGIIAAVKRNTFIDGLLRTLTIVGISMPTYWVGSLMLLVFGFYLKLFPLGGVSALGVVLPAVSVGITGSAFYARILRSSMLEVMRLDFVRTANAKGLSRRRVLFAHTVRNALLPVVTYLGLDLGALLGGLIITEVIFDWTGLGYLLNQAISNLDASLIIGITLFSATAIVVVNLLVDIAYAFLDPRVSYS